MNVTTAERAVAKTLQPNKYRIQYEIRNQLVITEDERVSKSKIDIDRLIAAAQEIERIKNASREQSAELARLAKKARAGTLTAEDREYSYSMQRVATANSLDSAVDELVGALHSKPATWK